MSKKLTPKNILELSGLTPNNIEKIYNKIYKFEVKKAKKATDDEFFRVIAEGILKGKDNPMSNLLRRNYEFETIPRVKREMEEQVAERKRIARLEQDEEEEREYQAILKKAAKKEAMEKNKYVNVAKKIVMKKRK